MVAGTVGAGSQVHPAAGTVGSHLAAVKEFADVEALAGVEECADVEKLADGKDQTSVLVPSPVAASEGETGTACIAGVD